MPPPDDLSPPPAPDRVPSLGGPVPPVDPTLAFATPPAGEPRRRAPLLATAAIVGFLAVGGGGYAVGLAVGHSDNSNAPATSGALGSNTGSLGTPSKPFSGDVTAVNGSMVTVTDTLSGATETVELTSRTTVRLVNYGTELDIKPGSTITVQGPRISGNVFRARVVTIDSGPTP